MEQLFAAGKSFAIFPIKVFFTGVEGQDNRLKVAVGASARNFKTAVQRNRIKRLLREAYRMEKLPLHDFLEKNEKQCAVFFLYIDKMMPQYLLLKEKMNLAIRRLIKELSEKNS